MVIKKISLNEENLIMDNEKLIITIGAFDGIHLGHKKLINELLKTKVEKKDNYKTAVLTFDLHPDLYLNKRIDKAVIEDNENRYNEFSSFGIDYLFILESDVLKLTFQDFHRKILDRINTKIIIVGEEFKYGYKALGNVETLKEDYEVKTFLVKKPTGEKVSSTEIRSLLKSGNFKDVFKLLGHNYNLTIKNYEIIDDYTIISKVDYSIINNGIYHVKCNDIQCELIISDIDECKLYKISSKDKIDIYTNELNIIFE